MRRGAVLLGWILDLAFVLSCIVAAFVMVTGGGETMLAGMRVTAFRARNPLTIALALALIRLSLPAAGPFLGFSHLSMSDITEWAAVCAARACRCFRGLPAPTAAKALSVLILVSLLLRLANAWYYYGFFSGDDVEIHEMTFSVLFARDLGVWDLRCPFFPLAFIFPAQLVTLALGIERVDALVFAGRAVVAGWSCVGLAIMYFVARRQLGHPGAGLLAALLLSVMRLHVRFGATELPRPVAAAFLLLAFGLLLVRKQPMVCAGAAGLAVGVAAAMRFSEAVFLLPLAVHLVMERRLRDLAVAFAVSGLTAAAIVGVADLAYWGHAFHSLRHIVDFTLVQRASSRGTQPAHYYLTTSLLWSNVCMLILFAAGARREWRAALWAILPIVALSALPHKEERYLVPMLPFVALVATAGGWRLLNAVCRGRRERWAPYVFLLLGGAMLLELEGARCRRSEGAVDVARYLARVAPRAAVGVEQAWRAGSRVYLPDARLVDLDPRRLDEATYLWGVLRDPRLRFVVLRARETAPDGRHEVLRRAGFHRVTIPETGRDPDLLYERVSAGARPGVRHERQGR